MTTNDQITPINKPSKEIITCGVCIGRFNPVHQSHEMLINKLLEFFPNNHLVMIGSSNNQISFRNLFNYSQRKEMLRMLYPNLRLINLPDYRDSDEIWMEMVLDTIETVFDGKVHHPAVWTDKGDGKEKVGNIEPTFFFGSYEDSLLFRNRRFECRILNRYEEGKGLSASAIRDRLVNNKQIDDLVNENLIECIKKHFDMNWEKLKSI